MPTRPEPFDSDLTDLEIKSAPKDADIVFLGDSITDRWRFRPELWRSLGRAANLGLGGSRTANLLWLVNSGKLQPFHPKLFVIRIGVNDLFKPRFLERRVPSIADVNDGIGLIQASIRKQFPEAEVIVMPFPQSSELAADGIHLNDDGYKHWAKEIIARSSSHR